MIDVLDRQDRRNFFHKKLLRRAASVAASFVPGGSTALSIVSSLTGGGGGSKPAPKRAAAPVFVEHTHGAHAFHPPHWPRHTTPGVPPGHYSPPARKPSIPPVNPVRAAVVQVKPAEPLKLAPAPKRRVPPIPPEPKPHIQFPSTAVPVHRGDVRPFATAPLPQVFRPRAPAPTVRTAMPIHSRIRSFFAPAPAPSPAAGCVWPARIDPRSGQCRVFVGDQAGADNAPVGQAVMGKYGAAYLPGNMVIDRAVCLPGDVVGNDGMCYPRRSIRNSDREWPRGRRPLLTGGDMRAISIAHRAGARMTRAAGRLQDMGIIKKPIVRKQTKKQH